MAKSIYEVLDSLITETSVPAIGKVVEHTIPRDLLPTSEEFENEEKLLAWAQENDVLHACMQSGVQKRIIDLRAKFKAFKKDEDWTAEMGQKAVNASTWDIVKRPKASKSDENIVKDFLAKMTPKERLEWINENM